MRVEVNNQLRIENPSQTVKDWCKANLVLDNPDYTKKLRMNLWVGRTPEKLTLYEWDGDTLVLPYGCLVEIEELVGSKDSITITMPPPKMVWYGADIPLYDYQQEAVQAMLATYYGILQAPAGSGKGLPLNAKIYTPHGYTRNGDLQIGDEVLNSYGGISTVTGIYDRGKQFCYKIVFTDDTSIVCDRDHLWFVQNPDNSSKWLIKSTDELYREGVCAKNGKRKWNIPISDPVCFTSKKVTIDPWLLGVLLGDGSFSGDGVSISSTESDILQRCAESANCRLSPKTDGVSYGFADNGSLYYKLKDYDLQGLHSWEKFIPKDYKYNSVEIRLNVLRGLIDSDGSVAGTQVSITSTSKRLIEDALEIVQSLGGTGRISTRHTHYTYKGEKKEGRESYRLHLKLYKFEPFSSEKHKNRCKIRSKYVKAYRKIKSITITSPRVTRCITVDSDNSLYLTDNFVVTHNTQMGVAIATNLGRRALWLTHTHDLLQQSKERAEQYIDPSLIGTITEGRVQIGRGITFATVQTMSKIDLTRYKDMWDVIITDECHRVAGSPTTLTQFSLVLNNLAARHKYGLSATVHRADGLIKSTYALLGKVVYTVSEDAVADKIVKVGVLPRPTTARESFAYLNTDGTLNYTALVTWLGENTERNEQIVNDLTSNADHYNLILSDRVSHLRSLMESLPLNLRKQAVMIDGKMISKKGKAERAQALEDMRRGTKRYLFATYALAKEGLDVPRLDRLYLTTPQKDYAVITQSLGRIARAFEGKDAPVCYDYVDTYIPYLVRAYKKRCTTYRKLKYPILEG